MPTEELGLYETLALFPNIEFEADRVATHDTAMIIPLMWVIDDNLEKLTPDSKTIRASRRSNCSLQSTANAYTE